MHGCYGHLHMLHGEHHTQMVWSCMFHSVSSNSPTKRCGVAFHVLLPEDISRPTTFLCKNVAKVTNKDKHILLFQDKEAKLVVMAMVQVLSGRI